jgi:effector-binding domain-containing protein
MIDKPAVTTARDQHYAMLHVTVPRSKIQEVMGPGLGEVNAAITAQGAAAAGPWFTHHLRMDDKVFDFEICVPVRKPVSASDRVKPGKLHARRVARTVYRGGYEGLGAAWGELSEWIRKQGLKPSADLWEVYLTDPATTKDPAAYQTELNQPLME